MEPRGLTRSNNTIIAGVCAGIAEHIGWSATTVRLAYAFLAAISAAFPGILVYLVLWVVMPKPENRSREFNVHRS
jgi:phage shock protein C